MMSSFIEAKDVFLPIGNWSFQRYLLEKIYKLKFPVLTSDILFPPIVVSSYRPMLHGNGIGYAEMESCGNVESRFF